jgi:erythromycin esterase-like protein
MLLRVLFALALAAPPAAPQSAPVKDWIATHAIRLDTPQAGHGLADMQPLKQVVGDALIVSLGEATHGTREFFQLKHRMLEFLATQMGFTIFSIEANMPEAYRLNDYVLNGQGDPAELLRGMYFWTWNTEEVLDMIRWMREFNRSGKGRLQFTGFDMQTTKVAEEIARGFATRYDPDFLPTIREAAEASSKAGNSSQKFGSVTGSFPVPPAAGKKVRFSGYIKTDKVTDGYAGLWWRVDGASGVLDFANLRDRAPKGTTDWKHYELEISVSTEATRINFGALLAGNGAAWFDGLTVELDGKPYEDREPLRFLENPRPYNDYRMRLDPEVRRGEKPALQISHIPEPGKSDPQAASAAWRNVVLHLESARAAYEEKKASAQEIDWAIRNARVVLQCMQMKTGEVTRDRSMAENVKWILDHNPGAKIVLWAHNGHVNATSAGGWQPMGASLRDIYGESMIVFGFAFNQGSFQAVEQGKGLRDFTVSPAPDRSLDATLASASIPLLALDLRRLPQDGPVQEWFRQPQWTRSIGAVYSEEAAAAYFATMPLPKAFDAILFVEKTTAARKNQPTPRR